MTRIIRKSGLLQLQRATTTTARGIVWQSHGPALPATRAAHAVLAMLAREV